ALERAHHDQRPGPGARADPVRRQLLLVALRWQEGPTESVELDDARVDGALAPAAPQLGREAAHRVPRAVRVQFARVARRLPASEPARARACGIRPALSEAAEWQGRWRR